MSILSHSTIPETPVHVGADAEDRLHRLGIPGLAPLVNAVRGGASAARATTEFHPRSYRGPRMWAETHASLAHGLKPRDWTPECFMGADLLLNTHLGLALIVTAGDNATGKERYSPQVRYERHEVITGLVNGYADNLFTAGDRPGWSVWFLLHHLTGAALQAELSKPSSITNAGWVSSWQERIVLPESGTPTPQRRAPRKTTDIDVPVGRRVA